MSLVISLSFDLDIGWLDRGRTCDVPVKYCVETRFLAARQGSLAGVLRLTNHPSRFSRSRD